MATAIHFFLGVDDEKDQSDEEDDMDVPDLTAMKHTALINKKTKSRKVQMKKALNSIKKVCDEFSL